MSSRDVISERVEVKGHILDSLIFSHMLDEILALGGEYEILRLEVGHSATNPSYAQILVKANAEDKLSQILRRLGELGADRIGG